MSRAETTGLTFEFIPFLIIFRIDLKLASSMTFWTYEGGLFCADDAVLPIMFSITFPATEFMAIGARFEWSLANIAKFSLGNKHCFMLYPCEQIHLRSLFASILGR